MSGSIKEITRFENHNNAFGFMRLLFASLVIVSHTPELIDGNRSREILTRLFGTLSFGELAVDGFFILSGYLITGSYLNKNNVITYIIKRISRIYPAYIVCTIFCVFIVAPLAGASAADIWSSTGFMLRGMINLYPPYVPNAFTGTPYAALNGAMWTIIYEFHCYILVLILGIFGVFRRPWLILVASIACMIGFQQTYFHGQNPELRLVSIFMAGSLFYLWRKWIVFTPIYATAALSALLGFMLIPSLAEPAVAVFGSYVIFSIATFGGSWSIAKINNRDDISYGVYLYAWPIEKLILWFIPSPNPLLVGTLTFLVACAFGWMSWHWLEKRVMRQSMRWNAPERLEPSPLT